MIEAAWNTYVKIPLPWVRTLGPDYWKNQKEGDRHGPDKYRRLQPESHILLEAIESVAKPSDCILDLGCGPGRHIRALHRRGYAHVRGLDVAQTFELGLPAIRKQWYDVVFTFGTTIELVPPSFPICHHIARIAKKAVILMIHETDVPYPRLWKQEFRREGLRMTRYEPGDLTLFVFQQ